jgi:hypothetical protein
MSLYFLQISSSRLSLRVRISRKETPISYVMSLRLSVRLSACYSAPTGRIFVEFCTGNFYINQSRNPKLFKSRKNIGHFLRRPTRLYIVDSNTKSFVVRQQCIGKPLLSIATLHSFILLTAKYESTIFFIFYGKNGYANAPRWYVILTLGVLLTYLAKFRKCSFTFLHMKLKNSSSYFLKNDQFKTKMDTNTQ